jgi:hypothetical protein
VTTMVHRLPAPLVLGRCLPVQAGLAVSNCSELGRYRVLDAIGQASPLGSLIKLFLLKESSELGPPVLVVRESGAETTDYSHVG